MKFKTALILIFLNFNILKPNVLIDWPKLFATKMVLFYTSQFIGTLSHELGHAFVSKLRNFNPKIIIGATKGEYKKLKQFITINESYDPNCGVTLSNKNGCKEEKKTRETRDLIQLIMGPAFGVISRILQLMIVEKLKDRLGNNLLISLRNFISAQLISQIIYGLTPFDQYNSGDGAKIMNLLNLRYRIHTNFFNDIQGLQSSFSLLKNYGFKIYATYGISKIVLKAIENFELIDVIENKFDNKILKAICSYLKVSTINKESTQNVEEVAKNLNRKKEDVEKYYWINTLIANSIFV